MIPAAMNRIIGKLVVTMMLTLCVGVCALELSGHWDRTFKDANDEAGAVAIVLCVGIAVSAAFALRAAIRPFLMRSRFDAVLARLDIVADGHSLPLPSPASDPPLPLRI